MKNFNNDDKVILQQKIIHLGAEVRRLTADVEKLNSKTYLKHIEKERTEYERKIEDLTNELAELKSQGEEKANHLQQEIVDYQKEISKQRELHVSRTATLQDEVFELKKDLSKQREEHQNKLVTISNEVSGLKQQCEKERTAHLKAIEVNEALSAELVKAKRELAKQSTINMDLEKEYEMVKETVKSLLMKIESSNQEKMGYQQVADINEKLEEENMAYRNEIAQREEENKAYQKEVTELEKENKAYRKEVADLKEELKNLQGENSLFVDDIKKLNKCVSELEKQGNQLIHESTVVSNLIPQKPVASPEPDKRMQSWFYNNLKKNT
ncbi:hypothetical protein AB685_09700 [Bacillus sp. LL01]|uniref:hypothetical protein n=1 Tax=Bacillus sp. LL01 TaxID=1665556 RepID=UPI00064D453B|nr:hypothetical protein [Bacillus sp. LL01]KMJ58181.1 hypothetical protein AB685_09700 [Bacillus sp. LL01]